MELKEPTESLRRRFLNLRIDTAPSDYSDKFSQDCDSETTHGIQDSISVVTVVGKDQSPDRIFDPKLTGEFHSGRNLNHRRVPLVVDPWIPR